jgi:hypothetical protein
MQLKPLDPKRPGRDDDDESPPSTQRSPTYPEPEPPSGQTKLRVARSETERFSNTLRAYAISGG